MSQNHYDLTGILILDKVTPVINALFGDFNLDPDGAEAGQAYIAQISELNDPDWDSVCDNLAELAESLKLVLPEDAEPSTAEYLYLLAEHFGVRDDDTLENLLEHHDFDGNVEVDVLFELATRLNDGHGLKAVQCEGCWHSDKARLFNFGGNGFYLSQNVQIHTSSDRAGLLGSGLDSALSSGDIEAAAILMKNEVSGWLESMSDDSKRSALQTKLRELLV